MRIGILSMQRVHNYGSFLQAYALKSILENMGHTVLFIDIEQTASPNPMQPETALKKLLSKREYIDRYLIKRYLFSKKNAELDRMFQETQQHYLGILPNEEKVSAQNCDAVVIGSDEVFNCEPNSKWGVSCQRFGDIPDVTTFSYAASCGYTSVSDIAESDHAVIESALGKMKMVSVRDQNTLDFVKHFHIQNAMVNLDPVFIYSFDAEIQEAEALGYPTEPYMIVYAYHNRIDDKKEIATIKKYAKKHGLKTIAIGGSLPWCDEFVVIQPFQVLAWFKHASCIVTDTFHGSVMAAKLNKPFAVFVRDSNRNKLSDLLMRVAVEEHRVDVIQDLEEVLDKPVDYQLTNKIIETERERAIQYLYSVLRID